MDEADQADGAGRDEGSGDAMTMFSALAARMDPVPAAVLEAARSSFTWRTIDAELAEIAFDSVVSQPLAGVRGAVTGPRLLTFEAPGLVVELEVTEVGDRRRLVGQIVPTGAADVEVRSGGGTATATATADHMGRFAVDEVPGGPVSVRVLRPGTDPVETDWISL